MVLAINKEAVKILDKYVSIDQFKTIEMASEKAFEVMNNMKKYEEYVINLYDASTRMNVNDIERYASCTVRLSTFDEWIDCQSNTTELAKAGFYYVSDGGMIRCFTCGVEFADWKVSLHLYLNNCFIYS